MAMSLTSTSRADGRLPSEAGSPARDLIAISLWAAFWIVYFIADFASEDWAVWASVLVPNLLLGFVVGRWWVALLPFALVALAAFFSSEACMDVDCGDVGAVPAWAVVLIFIAPRGAAAALLGVALRRMANRRRQRSS